MRIMLINPNTSRAMTEKIAEAAREVAGPDVLIEAVCPEVGAAAIESHTDEIAAAAAVIEAIQADRDGPGPADAYVIACFGDPGLDAAREIVEAPVVGIAEAAMHLAAVSGRHFGVVTTLSRTLGRAEDLVTRYGMERACVSLEATGIPVLDLEDTGSEAVKTIERYGARAAADGADVIVLGCAGMADLCTELTERIGVPVVDGVAAAVGMASGMVRMGLRTSKRDEYARPPRPFVGAAATGSVPADRGGLRAVGRPGDDPVHTPGPGEASADPGAPTRALPPQAGDLPVFA